MQLRKPDEIKNHISPENEKQLEIDVIKILSEENITEKDKQDCIVKSIKDYINIILSNKGKLTGDIAKDCYLCINNAFKEIGYSEDAGEEITHKILALAIMDTLLADAKDDIHALQEEVEAQMVALLESLLNTLMSVTSATPASPSAESENTPPESPRSLFGRNGMFRSVEPSFADELSDSEEKENSKDNRPASPSKK